jgi:hypothetical protein
MKRPGHFRREEAAGMLLHGAALGPPETFQLRVREASATGCEFAGCKFAFLVHGHFISRPRVNSADNVAT